MVGVELAPPAPGLRWGRRVCAGAVARGVLLRPLGDVVVIMPPLTTTEDEIVRIVDALDGGAATTWSPADRRPATAAARRTEPLGRPHPGRAGPGRRRGSLAPPREFDALGPAGAPRRWRRSSPSRPTTTSG